MNNKLVFIIHGLPIGGAERFLIILLNYFSKKQYEVHLILLSNDDKLLSELNSDIFVYRVLKNTRYDLLVSIRLRKIVETIDPLTIICINTYAFFLTKFGLIFNNKYTVILSPHTTRPITWYNYFQNLVYYRFINKNDKIIYLCNAQMSYLQKVYHFSTHKKYIVYNGVDCNYFDAAIVPDHESIALKKRLGILYEDKVIVQVARIQREKRHEDSIKALAILNSKYECNVHLLLVGGGNLKRIENLQSLVQQLGIQKQVHFLNNHNDVRVFYKAADLFTLTSESETFSLAALEAMSFGLPVVLTKVGGAAEMVDNYKNGFTVPVNNIPALVDAWDKALSLHFDSNAIRGSVIKKFNVNQMQRRYHDILQGNEEPLINI